MRDRNELRRRTPRLSGTSAIAVTVSYGVHGRRNRRDRRGDERSSLCARGDAQTCVRPIIGSHRRLHFYRQRSIF